MKENSVNGSVLAIRLSNIVYINNNALQHNSIFIIFKVTQHTIIIYFIIIKNQTNLILLNKLIYKTTLHVYHIVKFENSKKYIVNKFSINN